MVVAYSLVDNSSFKVSCVYGAESLYYLYSVRWNNKPTGLVIQCDHSMLVDFGHIMNDVLWVYIALF